MKKRQSSNSDDYLIEKTESSLEYEYESAITSSNSSDSEFITKYKSKSNSKPNSKKIKRQISSSESSLEASLSESETETDQQLQLESDSVSESNSTSSNESEIVSESSVNSDIEPILTTSTTDNDLDKIIGINQPTFDASFIPLMFYVKYKNKSYRSCEWIDEETLTNTKKGRMFHSNFRKNETPFRPVHFFNQTVSTSSNEDDEFKLYKPTKVEFDEGFVTPERIISIQTQKNGKKNFLVKWISLDMTESTWETEISEDLIEKYNESNLNAHDACYDHSGNQNLREFVEMKESPIYKNENVLADYQVNGLNWLQFCWFKRVNSILADEMGLGKTIESISMIDCLSKWYPKWGPFLIVCPVSTISNWLIELENWTNFRVVCMMGTQENLNMTKKYLIYQHIDEKEKLDKEKIIFDIILISYENLAREIDFITKFNFMYTIIDEAQRIKNFKTIIYQDCMAIRSYHKLLMTGTPIQNNLYEIWSLLHYVDPINFIEFKLFKNSFDLRKDPTAIERIQEVIRPYILRRKKNDVSIELPEKEETIIEVEMTQVQRNFSQIIIRNNLGALKDILATKVNLNNIMMQLRKLFCHPYLIPKLKDICYSKYKKSHEIPKSMNLDPEQEMDSLVLSSGKMILIDKLLPKLKEGKHKVLIFSQMTTMLDIIEDYLIYKEYVYERLDGSFSIAHRTLAINRFQKDENVFVFLLSTRAGGLGINLTSADTVIIYDGDWNPQNDIQAQARCHRIGQTKKVNVYRLITRGCYESEMFSRASKKLALDFAILDSNPNVSLDIFNSNGQLSESELRIKARLELQTILKKGAYYTFNDDPNEIDKFCSENIDQILNHRSHARKDLINGGNSRFSKVSFDTKDVDDTEVNKSDFWNKLVGINSSDDYDEEIQKPKKKSISKKKSKKDVVIISSESSSLSSSVSSRSSSPSPYSYYTASDNDFSISDSEKSLEDESEESLSAVSDDYDDYDDENKDYYDDDEEIIEVSSLFTKSSNKKVNPLIMQNQSNVNSNQNIIDKSHLFNVNSNQNFIDKSNLFNVNSISLNSPLIQKVNYINDSGYNFGNQANFSDVQSLVSSLNMKGLLDIIRKFNKSIDQGIYKTAFYYIKNHGIYGSQFYISEFMQEIGKSLFILAYYRLPYELFQKYSSECNQYIQNIPKQMLKTPFLEFTDDKFLSSLFNGNELEFLNDIIKKDEIYKAALFISNEKLPEKYQFVPEMYSPIGWTPVDDFIIITSSVFLNQITDIVKDEKLHFTQLLKDFPSLNKWIQNRIELIVKEVSLFIPHDYSIYENIEGKMIHKKFGNIEKFKELNDHVVHPQKLTINYQKKLLKLFYLYGIPKDNGIQKIKTILKIESLFSDELILIFTVKILINAIKYKPDLIVLLKCLRYTNFSNIYDNDKVDIRWIKKEAIQAVASNLDIIFKVRENYSINLNLDGIPDWTDIKKKYDWWNSSHDVILFKTVAYYGFIFNSMLCKFIPSKEIDDITINEWRNEEIFSLCPIKHPKMNYLEQILPLDVKKTRIKQILDFLKCHESKNENKK